MRKLAPIALVLLVACGGFNRQKALSDSMTAVNAGRDGLIVWQQSCQEHAVEIATTESVAKQMVLACREKRDRVVKLFVIAYSTLALAMMSPDETNYVNALLAVRAVMDAVKGLE